MKEQTFQIAKFDNDLYAETLHKVKSAMPLITVFCNPFLGLDVIRLDKDLKSRYGYIEDGKTSTNDFITKTFGRDITDACEKLIYSSRMIKKLDVTGYEILPGLFVYQEENTLWNISHVISGFSVANGYSTRSKAVKAINNHATLFDWLRDSDTIGADSMFDIIKMNLNKARC